jgi:hypothetical protein
LINQDCVLTEVEAQTLAVVKSQPLGFGMSVCAGLALGLDGNHVHRQLRDGRDGDAVAATG